MRFWMCLLIGTLFHPGVWGLAGTIRGTAYDVDGRVVRDARVLLMVDYVKQREQQTGQAGEFRFDGLAPGRYEVQIKKGRMFIFQNTVILEKAEQDTVIYAVLPIARMTDRWGVSTRLPEGVKKLAPVNSSPAVGGEVELAAPIAVIRMPYPAEARSQGIEGQVALFARITVDGTLSDAIVLSSPHEVLTKAVLDSLPKARYRPMRLNGHPVACGIDLLIEFTLTSSTPRLGSKQLTGG